MVKRAIPQRRASTKRKSPVRKEARGRIEAKRSRAAYARRLDERVASDIDKAVTAASQIRDQILQKIDRGLHERKGAQRVGLSKRKRR